MQDRSEGSRSSWVRKTLQHMAMQGPSYSKVMKQALELLERLEKPT